MGGISCREGKLSDAWAIGRLHVDSWRETYAGLLPDELLDSLSVEARSAMWSSVLGEPDGSRQTAVFVAESGGEIVGFGACGGQRDEGLRNRGFIAEIGALYVRKSNQGAGIGRCLMGHLARKLLEQGRAAASLWVLRENISARRFYERMGGTRVGERVGEQGGATLYEVAYGWSDLAIVPGITLENG